MSSLFDDDVVVVVVEVVVVVFACKLRISTDTVIFCFNCRKQTAGITTAPTGKSIEGQRTPFTINVAVPASSLFKSSSSSTMPELSIFGKPPAIDSVAVTISPDDGS